MKRSGSKVRFGPVEAWENYVRSLSGSSGYQENLLAHVRKFVFWLMKRLQLEVAADGTLLPSKRYPDPVQALSRALFHEKRLYVELYFERYAREVSLESLRSVCSSIRSAYQFWHAKGLTQITAADVANPRSRFGHRVAIVEAWIGAQTDSLEKQNSKRYGVSRFLHFVEARCPLLKNYGVSTRRERRVFEALHAAPGWTERSKVLAIPKFSNTLTAEVLLRGDVHIRPYLTSLGAVEGATAIKIRDVISYLRRFYVWLHDKKYSQFDPEKIINPLSQISRSPRREATRPPSALPQVSKPKESIAQVKQSSARPVSSETAKRSLKKGHEATRTSANLRQRRELLKIPNLTEILKLRDRLITGLMRNTSQPFDLSDICSLEIGHISADGTSLHFPRKGRKAIDLGDSLVQEFARYLEELFVNDNFRRVIERNGIEYLFPSLDGGMLVVDDSHDSVFENEDFQKLRNIALESFVRQTNWGFGVARQLTLSHVSGSWTEYVLRNGNTIIRESLSVDAQEKHRRYAEFVRNSPMKSSWGNDLTQAPVYLALDGQSLTADESF